MPVRTRRAYDPPLEDDGRRYLVDRLWPRGRTKDALRLDGWLKEIAPSARLRSWFGHVPERFPTFRERYRKELAQKPMLVKRLVAEARRGTVTLVFGARDPQLNDAAVLQEYLEERLAPRTRPPASIKRPKAARARRTPRG